MFEIEKDVPIHRSMEARFPFHKMEVGDSFFVPNDAGINQNNLNTYFRRAEAKHTGTVFKSRKVENGRRVWRVA